MKHGEAKNEAIEKRSEKRSAAQRDRYGSGEVKHGEAKNEAIEKRSEKRNAAQRDRSGSCEVKHGEAKNEAIEKRSEKRSAAQRSIDEKRTRKVWGGGPGGPGVLPGSSRGGACAPSWGTPGRL